MFSKFPLNIHFWGFISWLLGKRDFTRPVRKQYQKAMLKYLKKEYKDIINDYQSLDYSLNNISVPCIPKIIWVFWWQDNYEDLKYVNKCICRMRNIKGFNVNLLTKNNINDYIDISDVSSLIIKEGAGIPFLSDIVRARILYKYGGFWLDATIVILDDSFLDSICKNLKFFSCKRLPYYGFNVCKGLYSGNCWGTFVRNPLFGFLDTCLTFFIKKHRAIIDYVLIDYTIMVGYYNIPVIKQLIDSVPISNPAFGSVNSLLQQKFDQDKWQKIIEKTCLLKFQSRYIVVDHMIEGSFGDYIFNKLL